MAEAVGTACEKKSLIFDWNIPYFLRRLKDGLQFESPYFVFCDEEWYLTIIPGPSLEVPSSMNTMALVLTKQNFSFKKHYIIYKVSIIGSHGREHMCIEGTREFLESDDSTEIYNFDTYSEVSRYRNKIAPDGTLTISCTFICDQHIWESESTSASTSQDEYEDEYKDAYDGCDYKGGSYSANKDVIPDVIDSKKLMQDMEALFLKGKNSDVALVAQNKKFPVHRSILGARSSVFEAMFSHDTVEATSGVVTITDFEPGVFHDFLLYLYSAKVKRFSRENVFGLYSAADKYNIQELKPKCVEFMKGNLSISMLCSVLSLALQHKESSLLKAATEFFVKNLRQVIVSVEWQEFLKENPIAANELHIKAADFYVPRKSYT